jgi:hypothetical protein
LAPLLKALAAENRTPLGRSKGYGGFLSTVRAGGASFDLGETVISVGCCSEDRDSFCFARFAALGLVLELFVVKEELLSGGEDEVSAAIDTV